MTEKELLYIEDLLGAEKLAEKLCQCHSQSVKDEKLKSHFSRLALTHKENVSKLYNLLQ